MKWAIGLSIEVDGLENLDKNKQYIFTPNHTSLLDIVALNYAIPNGFTMISKKELFKVPFLGWAMWTSHCTPLDREDSISSWESINEAFNKAAKLGISLLVFPEGTISKDYYPQRFKRGAFVEAVRREMSVVPVTVIGVREVLPRRKGLFKIHRSKKIKIVFACPVKFTGEDGGRKSLFLADAVRSEVVRTLRKEIS